MKAPSKRRRLGGVAINTAPSQRRGVPPGWVMKRARKRNGPRWAPRFKGPRARAHRLEWERRRLENRAYMLKVAPWATSA